MIELDLKADWLLFLDVPSCGVWPVVGFFFLSAKLNHHCGLPANQITLSADRGHWVAKWFEKEFKSEFANGNCLDC